VGVAQPVSYAPDTSDQFARAHRFEIAKRGDALRTLPMIEAA
jgi:hypothetical protein